MIPLYAVVYRGFSMAVACAALGCVLVLLCALSVCVWVILAPLFCATPVLLLCCPELVVSCYAVVLCCAMLCCAVGAQVYSESAPMKQALPDYLAEYMQRKLAMAGVTPVAVTSLTGLR